MLPAIAAVLALIAGPGGRPHAVTGVPSHQQLLRSASSANPPPARRLCASTRPWPDAPPPVRLLVVEGAPAHHELLRTASLAAVSCHARQKQLQQTGQPSPPASLIMAPSYADGLLDSCVTAVLVGSDAVATLVSLLIGLSDRLARLLRPVPLLGWPRLPGRPQQPDAVKEPN
jgi:hypothetical protein